MSETIQNWRPFFDTRTGERFDLSHLNAVKIQITQSAKGSQPAKHTSGLITFSHHCFTRTPDDNEAVSVDQIYFEPSEEGRLFCHDRYELSKSVLINIVHQKLTNGATKCFHTERGTFMIIETVDYQNNPVSYEVYFNMFKSRMDDVDVYIRMHSAFIRDSRQRKRVSNIPRISLSTIAFKTIQGQSIPTRRR